MIFASTVLTLLLSATVVLGGESKRAPSKGWKQAEAVEVEAPVSFSHFSLEQGPPHQDLPLLRLPLQNSRSVPVAVVSPYYVETPVPVKEVPWLSRVPVQYIGQAQYGPQYSSQYSPQYHQHIPFQPYYKQYHALRSKDFALCRWSNSVHMVRHPLLRCDNRPAYLRHYR